MTLFAPFIQRYDAIINRLQTGLAHSLLSLFIRVVLGGIFWRSGQTKVEENSWFTLTETTYELFRTEYAAVPLPPDLAATMANAAEHIFPVLLFIGLFTRFSAFALLGMTMVIQIFVYPDAWWTEHALWAALAATLIIYGGGNISCDALLVRATRI